MSIKKLKIDYDKYNRENIELVKKDKLLHEYLKNDCKIVAIALDKLYNKVTRNKKNKSLFGLTLFSISLKSFKYFVDHYSFKQTSWEYLEYRKLRANQIMNLTYYNILFDGFFNGITKKLHTIFRVYFFRGGYCSGKFQDVNKWIKCKNGKSFDVNSLYPYIMMTKPIPCGKVFLEKPKFAHLEFLLIKIFNLKPKKKEYIPLVKNLLPYELKEKNGKTLYLKYFASENRNYEFLEIGFLKEELEFILKYYEIEYEVEKRYFFRSTTIMNEYILTIKKNKENAKTPIEKKVAKIKQNSLYGKFGQSLTKGRCIYDDEIIDQEKVVYGKNITRKIYLGHKNSDIYRNPLVAATITAYARLELWQAIFDNYDNFLYSDTDSIWLKEEPRNLIIHETAYGAWKLEHEFKEFKWIRAKCYAYIDHENNFKPIISGLSNVKKHLVNKDNFNIGLSFDDVRLTARRVKGGVLLKKTKFTIRDTFNNNIDFVVKKWESKNEKN